jgi:hypothetical protein
VQLSVLMLVRSIRLANFEMHTESLSNLVPWFFALNHQNYARWASVHLRDMCMLTESHPGVAQEIKAGRFTVNKCSRPFSSISHDQAHEQLNARVKGLGGAISLTENLNALLRWMVEGPEVSRVLVNLSSPVAALVALTVTVIMIKQELNNLHLLHM